MKQGYIFIAIATIMFSTFEVALKYIAGEINSVQLTFARFFIGFLFLAPLAWRTLKKRGLSLDRKSVAYFALLGLVGIAICMPIYQLSVNYVDSGVVAVLFSCNPVFVTFLAFLFLGEAIRGRHIAALVLEVLGTVAIINPFETVWTPSAWCWPWRPPSCLPFTGSWERKKWPSSAARWSPASDSCLAV